MFSLKSTTRAKNFVSNKKPKKTTFPLKWWRMSIAYCRVYFFGKLRKRFLSSHPYDSYGFGKSNPKLMRWLGGLARKLFLFPLGCVRCSCTCYAQLLRPGSRPCQGCPSKKFQPVGTIGTSKVLPKSFHGSSNSAAISKSAKLGDKMGVG